MLSHFQNLVPLKTWKRVINWLVVSCSAAKTHISKSLFGRQTISVFFLPKNVGKKEKIFTLSYGESHPAECDVGRAEHWEGSHYGSCHGIHTPNNPAMACTFLWTTASRCVVASMDPQSYPCMCLPGYQCTLDTRACVHQGGLFVFWYLQPLASVCSGGGSWHYAPGIKVVMKSLIFFCSWMSCMLCMHVINMGGVPCKTMTSINTFAQGACLYSHIKICDPPCWTCLSQIYEEQIVEVHNDMTSPTSWKQTSLSSFYDPAFMIEVPTLWVTVSDSMVRTDLNNLYLCWCRKVTMEAYF